MLARDRLTLNEVSWLLVKVFFGSSYLGFVSNHFRCRLSMALRLTVSGFCCPGKIGGCGFGRICLAVWKTDQAQTDFAAFWHDFDVSRYPYRYRFSLA